MHRSDNVNKADIQAQSHAKLARQCNNISHMHLTAEVSLSLRSVEFFVLMHMDSCSRSYLQRKLLVAAWLGV